MSEAAEILVIIISTFLAFFLLLAVILLVMLIKVTRQIKSVTATAKTAADHLNEFASNMSKMASPMIIAKVILSQLKKFKSK